MSQRAPYTTTDAPHCDFLSVPLLSLINKGAIFFLKVNMDVGHKSESEDILSLYQKKIKSNFGAPQIRKLNSFND